MAEKSFYFDPFAKGNAVFLGRTEARLMDIAWTIGNVTVKKALFYLKDEKLAYTTIMTVLSRLADKGLLNKTKSGRLYFYTPVLDRNKFIKNRLKIIDSCIRKNFKNTN
ncbi:MAG: BlaI/MecI/CopY family transcriptional regulator [candidate division Zixibacteria bacterium]|nr:BlaI/MecI/CopY family transcriptional regulator [candidate division Zixibacteria bacterium]